MEDQDEVHDSLLAAKDAKRSEESKLTTLNDVIVEALDAIDTQEVNVEILDGRFRSLVAEYGTCFEHASIFCVCQRYIFAGGPFFILDKLTEVAESSRLSDKMKVVFDQARNKEKAFASLMRDLCFSLRISLSKKRMLVAELEALVERGDAATPLEHMREIVARDYVLLGELEKLLARAQVGMILKDGYVTDMEKKD
nr:hypothetical protein [Tanacetum cinerariifolium]